MKKETNIVKYMEDSRKALEHIIEKRRKILPKMPEGDLKCFKNGNSFAWMRNYYEIGEDGKQHVKRERIKKKDFVLAEQLAIKGFHEEALRVEKRRLRAIEMFLRYYDPDTPGSKYLYKNDEYRRLATTMIKTKEYSKQELDWMNKQRPFEQPYQGGLVVPTVLGYNVRSKSEAEYVATFAKYGIVFRYEWPLTFDDYPSPLFPDFTILNPNTGETIILEHFGQMDDEHYVQENAKKILLYFKNGFYPGYNLMMSYETMNEKFTSLDAEQMVKENIIPKIAGCEDALSKEVYWM